MALLIPSKHIYDMGNPKIRDNFIDNVNVDITVISPNNDYETPIYSVEKEDFDYVGQNTIPNTEIKYEETSNSLDNYNRVRSAVGNYIQDSYSIYTIQIPKVSNNKLITRVLSDYKEGKSDIKFSIFFKKEYYFCRSRYNAYKNEFDFANSVIAGIPYEENGSGYNLSALRETGVETDSKSNVINMQIVSNEQKINSKIETTFFELGWGGGALINNLERESEPYLNFSDVEIEENDDLIILHNLKVVTNIKVISLHSVAIGKTSDTNTAWDETETSVAEGLYFSLTPQQIQITVYGDTQGIELTDSSVPYGSGNKPFSTSGNELLQDSATTNGKLTSEHLADNLLTQYQNGKETATILCDISDYYDYDTSEKVISITDNDLPMRFSIGDVVIPMVFGADGQDYPMSKYKDGTPKKFEVIGTNIYYDGAVWQELSLLEYTK